MPKYYDLSPSLNPNTPAWPTDPPVVFDSFKAVGQGGSSNVTRLTLGSHAGSHVDAPRHFFSEGLAVDKLPLDVLIGPVLVVESPEGTIDRPAMETALGDKQPERLLIKTGNSALWAEREFVPEFTGLTAEAAEYLVGLGVKLVGIDYLSIEAAHGAGSPVHRTLLPHNIIIVESINLSEVPPGEYELFCLPLKLSHLDGAPARVVLRDFPKR